MSKSLWTAVHVEAKRARESAKTTTIYSRRIENLPLWSDRNGVSIERYRTKKIAYQDFRNIDFLGRKIGAAGYGADKSRRLFS